MITTAKPLVALNQGKARVLSHCRLSTHCELAKIMTVMTSIDCSSQTNLDRQVFSRRCAENPCDDDHLLVTGAQPEAMDATRGGTQLATGESL